MRTPISHCLGHPYTKFPIAQKRTLRLEDRKTWGSTADRARMHELLEKAKAGKLTRPEKSEAENYERVGHLLSILKLKACASLKARNGDS